MAIRTRLGSKGEVIDRPESDFGRICPDRAAAPDIPWSSRPHRPRLQRRLRDPGESRPRRAG